MTLAFWNISNFSDVIEKVSGITFGAGNVKAVDASLTDPDFHIELDDTGAKVLLLENHTSATLTMSSAGVEYPEVGVVCEFIGQKPHRPK